MSYYTAGPACSQSEVSKDKLMMNERGNYPSW
jgi:hypothetical protein